MRHIEHDIIFEALLLQTENESVILRQEILLMVIICDDLLSDRKIETVSFLNLLPLKLIDGFLVEEVFDDVGVASAQ